MSRMPPWKLKWVSRLAAGRGTAVTPPPQREGLFKQRLLPVPVRGKEFLSPTFSNPGSFYVCQVLHGTERLQRGESNSPSV